jgi:hypothetical protein
MRLTSAIVLVLTLVSGSIARADCRVDGAASRPRLLELYTSEGCSSCPPADAWLSSVRPGAAVVPIAFHVDYWDSLGWKDRFAQAAFSQRQVAIASRTPTGAYTPEIVLDGQEWRAWRRGAQTEDPVPATGRLHVHVEMSTAIDVDWTGVVTTDDARQQFATYIALVEDGLSSDVRRGENSGRVLHHDHVVRAFVGPLTVGSGKTRLALPADLVADRASVVAWLQDDRSGSVADLVQQPLAACSGSRAQ